MAQRRRYGEDLAYAEWHRHALEHLYRRIGHRLHMGDRDWTEVCGYCREPLAVVEEVIDRGQDLNDKSTAWTRKLAERAGLDAFLVAPYTERPPEVQDEIRRLQARVLELQTRHPILHFTIRALYPEMGALTVVTPKEWAEHVLMVHRDHHRTCHAAARQAPRVNDDELRARKNLSRIFTPDGQLRLWPPMPRRSA